MTLRAEIAFPAPQDKPDAAPLTFFVPDPATGQISIRKIWLWYMGEATERRVVYTCGELTREAFPWRKSSRVGRKSEVRFRLSG